jgi:hypothetical protein
MEKYQDVFYDCIDAYGMDAQIEQAKEEMYELLMAFRRLQTNKDDKKVSDVITNVQEEIADVIIMMEQMKLIFGTESVNQFIEAKLLRQRERLRIRNEVQSRNMQGL